MPIPQNPEEGCRLSRIRVLQSRPDQLNQPFIIHQRVLSVAHKLFSPDIVPRIRKKGRFGKSFLLDTHQHWSNSASLPEHFGKRFLLDTHPSAASAWLPRSIAGQADRLPPFGVPFLHPPCLHFTLHLYTDVFFSKNPSRW
jgi:hypothetical protein